RGFVGSHPRSRRRHDELGTKERHRAVLLRGEQRSEPDTHIDLHVEFGGLCQRYARCARGRVRTCKRHVRSSGNGLGSTGRESSRSADRGGLRNSRANEVSPLGFGIVAGASAVINPKRWTVPCSGSLPSGTNRAACRAYATAFCGASAIASISIPMSTRSLT